MPHSVGLAVLAFGHQVAMAKRVGAPRSAADPLGDRSVHSSEALVSLLTLCAPELAAVPVDPSGEHPFVAFGTLDRLPID